MEAYYEGQEAFLKLNIAFNELNMYELTLLTAHPKLPFVIPMLRERDDSVQLIYALKGRWTLERHIMRSLIHYRDLMQILRELLEIFELAERYCLRSEQCLVEPTMIYYNPEKRRLEMLYLPIRCESPALSVLWKKALGYIERRAKLSLDPEGLEGFEKMIQLANSTEFSFDATARLQKEWIETYLLEENPKMDDKGETSAEIKENVLNAKQHSTMQIINQFNQKRHPDVKTEPLEHRSLKMSICRWLNCLSILFRNVIKFNSAASNQKADKKTAQGEYLTYEDVAASVANNHKSDVLTPEKSHEIVVQASERRPEGTTLLNRADNTEGKLILQNDQRCKIYEIVESITRIGRNHLLCEVAIEHDLTIGRVHAEIHRLDKQYFIKDIDSLNGTYVNGERVAPQTMYRLASNDKIRLSNLEIKFI